MSDLEDSEDLELTMSEILMAYIDHLHEISNCFMQLKGK